MTKPLSARQREILEFIQGFIGKHGYAPTYEEMRIAMGYGNRSTVAYQLEALELAGYIRRKVNRARAIWVVRITEGMRENDGTE